MFKINTHGEIHFENRFFNLTNETLNSIWRVVTGKVDIEEDSTFTCVTELLRWASCEEATKIYINSTHVGDFQSGGSHTYALNATRITGTDTIIFTTVNNDSKSVVSVDIGGSVAGFSNYKKELLKSVSTLIDANPKFFLEGDDL